MGAFKYINICFNFLEKDYGYYIANQIEKPAYDLFEYNNSKIGRSILLEANIREDHFLFAIANTEVAQPNWKQDIWKQRNNVLMFFDVFKKYEPDLVFADFDMGANYGNQAIEKNIQYLKKYGDKILRGIEWPCVIKQLLFKSREIKYCTIQVLYRQYPTKFKSTIPLETIE